MSGDPATGVAARVQAWTLPRATAPALTPGAGACYARPMAVLAPSPAPVDSLQAPPLERALTRWLGWLCVPLLACLAYAPVLRLGFLADDFPLLDAARASGLDLRIFAPAAGGPYQPLATLLTWQLGWQIWGLNPFPYHLLGLLLHAGVALALGLALAETTGRTRAGMAAGALFAVFPLHTEAVAWPAAQGEAWAALFAVLGLWLFVRAWRARPHARLLYVAALLSYTLALFSAASALALLPIYALAALIARPPDGAGRRRLAAALAPFALLLGANLALRVAGGGVAADPAAWPGSVRAALLVLLAPLNPAVFGALLPLALAVIAALLLLGLLAVCGPRAWSAVALAGAWIVLALIPALNAPVRLDDLQQNRYLYLAAAGGCALWAILLDAARGARRAPVRAVAAFLLVSILACSAQLGPWRVAATAAGAAQADLLALIPPQPRPQGLTWYVENAPASYRGAPIFGRGLDSAWALATGERPVLRSAPAGAQAPLAASPGDTFAIRFAADPAGAIVDLAGVTESLLPPAPGPSGAVWDFRACASGPLSAWQVAGARGQCAPEDGLALDPLGPDPQMAGPAPPAAAGAARFLRLRVGLRGPAAPGALGQWFWRTGRADWTEAHSRRFALKADGAAHVYWTFIPAGDLPDGLTGLRFDPTQGAQRAVVVWIAADWAP
jgi:protein O-mannosyl-transferase